MAQRASAKSKKARTGKVPSRGRVATLPKSALKAKGKGKRGNKHNGPPGMTDDQIRDWQGKLDRAYKKVTEAQDEVRQANGVYRNLLKAAGKEGFAKQAYIEARSLDKEDHGSVHIRFADIGRQLKVRGSNLATELGLFQDLEPPVVDDEAPAVKGLQAGRSGFARTSNPYVAGSEEYEAYDSNWLAGQTEIAQRMGDGGEATH